MAIGGHWSKCIQCGCDMWLPPDLYATALAMAGKLSFFCAHGHPQVFRSKERVREEDEIRRERDRLKQSVAQLEDSIRHWVGEKQKVERKLALTVKSAARTAKRVHNGTCPHCNRYFLQLDRHMHTKHKEAAE